MLASLWVSKPLLYSLLCEANMQGAGGGFPDPDGFPASHSLTVPVANITTTAQVHKQ